MEMNHFIGRRFNLISKSDIRYVGTLHDINPEASTIALENVVSHGTEGRRGNASEEIPPSTSVYEYIVFRGSDVKDINFAEDQAENKEPEPPQVPDDPAILGSSSRPPPQAGRGQPNQFTQPPPQPPPGYAQQPPFPNYYGPYGQRFGPPGFPPGPGFPNMPYGAPPQGWYPPPGQGFPQQPGQFPPQMPIGAPPGQPGQQQPQQRPGAAQASPTPPNVPKPTSELPVGDKISKPSSKPVTPAPTSAAGGAAKKPDVPQVPPMTSTEQKIPSASASLPPVSSTAPPSAAQAVASRSDRVIPAIPIATPLKPPVPTAGNAPLSSAPGNTGTQATGDNRTGSSAMEEATRAATAAVAAAMAKLPQPSAQNKQQGTNGMMESVTKKVGAMKPFDGDRGARAPHHNVRGGRGGHRGQHQQHQQHKKIEVPKTDFDFESANAKFNKGDLVKEAIASGSPIPESEDKDVAETSTNSADGADAAATVYDRTSSFFDNLSSEMRDREEHVRTRTTGREWRGEEEKKNIETFGQGSVDSGYRGGYRGRGRGRGYGGRGRGYSRGFSGRGRGGYRGPRDASQPTGVPAPI